MCVNLIKSIWIAVIIAVVLMLITSPSTATACKDMTANNFDSDACQTEAAGPPCCLTTDCLLSHHILTNIVDNEAILPNRYPAKENVYLVWSTISMTTETSPNPKKPPQREPSQELLSHTCTEYHCRNALASEEPPQV